MSQKPTTRESTEDSCCMCFTHKEGTLIIAFSLIILSITKLIAVSKGHMLMIIADPNIERTRTSFIVTCIVLIAINILLIFGVSLRKPTLMLPWLWMSFVGIIAYIITAAVIIVMLFTYASHHLWYWSVGLVLCAMLQLYSWSTVFTYYQKLVDREIESTSNQP